jgi:hypothetical protein
LREPIRIAKGQKSVSLEAHSAVRDMLRVEGVEKKTGRIDRFTMLPDAIEDFQKGAAPKRVDAMEEGSWEPKEYGLL